MMEESAVLPDRHLVGEIAAAAEVGTVAVEFLATTLGC
jgi:hypothetical protein